MTSLTMYSLDNQKAVALALRNDLIAMTTLAVSPATDELTAIEKFHYAFWFGMSDVQRYINHLDPDFPGFDGEGVLDAYVMGKGMIENAISYYSTHEAITIGDIMPIDEFIKDVKGGEFTDYDGFGYFSDGNHEWTRWQVNPSDLQDMIKAWPGFSHIVWFNK